MNLVLYLSTLPYHYNITADCAKVWSEQWTSIETDLFWHHQSFPLLVYNTINMALNMLCNGFRENHKAVSCSTFTSLQETCEFLDSSRSFLSSSWIWTMPFSFFPFLYGCLSRASDCICKMNGNLTVSKYSNFSITFCIQALRITNVYYHVTITQLFLVICMVKHLHACIAYCFSCRLLWIKTVSIMSMLKEKSTLKHI